ncbi:MAG: DUF2723 domain-containing protein [Candidatus Eisenbacteria bacterium]|nr:DUF2723 domain-containing protein [Candidatus Eisenbacteria bacterium]
MTDLMRRATFALGLVVLLLAATVYFITLTPTVPFWDSGEFIAVSNILGIPHPPGTPFYVMIGRIAAMLPIASIAQRLNGLSALASALAVLLTYLTILRLIRIAQGSKGTERTPLHEWIAQAGAVGGALMLAFSDNFWENAIEAEVYSMMSLAQILVFWLGLRWWEAHEKRPTAGPLLVCVYVMWVSVGVHLGVGMMGLPLLVLVALVDRRAALVFAMPLLSVLGVTFGLEAMAGVVILLSTLTFLVFAAQKKLPAWAAWGAVIPALYGMSYAFGDKDFTTGSAVIATASVLVPLAFLALNSREGKVIALALLLMAAGYSTHIYLPIRAAQHPAINEGNPSTWVAMRDLLERKQYGHTSMFVRRGTLQSQLDKEFWRYWKRQWPLASTLRTDGAVPQHGEPRLWMVLLPLLLGAGGAVWQARREKVTSIATVTLAAFSTVGMILFLNFSDHEVRDRDYFFTTGYHVYAVWIGMGIAWAIAWIRDSFETGVLRAWATAGAAALLLAQPFVLMKSLWYVHDRRGNYVAHDYAYNMLAPLAPNSYVFTNGDNDTFPLWYMQQVENFRKDVRVVNLSLLNTDWYIQQLKDDGPKVPIDLSDQVIRALGQGAIQDTSGRIIYTNQFMVQHIIEHSHGPDGTWIKQPYFAVTVPDHVGYDPYFTLEGLVYRVNPDSLHGQLDEPVTRRSLYQLFKYRGLFNADGSWDRTVYKDENASTLSHNYAAAHFSLAFYYHRRGQLDRAIAEMERVQRMFPDLAEAMVPLGGFYMQKGDTARAVRLFRGLAMTSPNNPEVRYYYGLTLAFQRDVAGALREFDAAVALAPDFADPYKSAYTLLLQAGQRERALDYLERLVNANPNEVGARQILESSRRSVRPEGALPPPPVPQP